MQGYHIAISSYRGCPAAVLLRGGRLHALEIDPRHNPHPRWGDIYQAKVSKLDTDLNCVFLRMGNGIEGYMPIPPKNDLYAGLIVTVKVMAVPSSPDKAVRVAMTKPQEKSDPLKLIRQGPDAARRMLNQYGDLAADIELTDNKLALSLQEEYPHLSEKIVVATTAHQLNENIFDLLGAADQIDTLTAPTVHLPGDGNLIIEQVHTMTVIDVNSGGLPVLNTNINAAREIARQLRLRNIGGIIIADMINMPRSADRKTVIETFEEEFAQDPCQVKLHGFTKLGLVEISRSRRTKSFKDCLAE